MTQLFHRLFTPPTMGFPTHVRMFPTKYLIKFFFLVSVFSIGVLSEKPYINRGESSSSKKIKNDGITVPLADNIWKPYTSTGKFKFWLPTQFIPH